ncbi:MAG: hypothetical protein COU07_03245 [Candidatus Harrisonbacteria bacterium CG10_big_fil_rev_8_21_14_0_10_40_38]|uniref:HD domain-containing protein n=1 Tax=Candidatus Harrisonbacteria bacterium CG10_big_fil_rev_8_21_14_0_10_40_38 TaxID=1974583 RepID=A0A2H0URN5_9BACT|nr:MAG: hypothetical protein COU07_03245 [Candidatus Harrisonbacteria bacterium CG10_big_fil_rev_8_21_14_0_10_40_38]
MTHEIGDRSYIEWLRNEMHELYSFQNTQSGHDVAHPLRMILVMQEMTSPPFPSFDSTELETAIWLHNLDRAKSLKERISYLGLRIVAERFLDQSPFCRKTKDEIILAVTEHSKKDDESDDPPLLQLVRILDKVDRLRHPTIELVSCGACYGDKLPLYRLKNPFGYKSAIKEYRSVYDNFFRILEWVGMLPLEAARNLAGTDNIQFFVTMVRHFGKDVAKSLSIENRVEEDIKKALGIYYDRYAT